MDDRPTAASIREWADDLRNERENGAAVSLDQIADEFERLQADLAKVTAERDAARAKAREEAAKISRRDADAAIAVLRSEPVLAQLLERFLDRLDYDTGVSDEHIGECILAALTPDESAERNLP